MSESFAQPEAPWALRLLPPFPSIAHRIQALAGRDDIDMNELADVAKMDPSFSAELLRLANSSLFSVRCEVKSLAQAIFLVGTERLKTMATRSPSTVWCALRCTSRRSAKSGFTAWSQR